MVGRASLFVGNHSTRNGSALWEIYSDAETAVFTAGRVGELGRTLLLIRVYRSNVGLNASHVALHSTHVTLDAAYITLDATQVAMDVTHISLNAAVLELPKYILQELSDSVSLILGHW
jgi:hypothetical protein